jgi:hypothetical protein
MARGRKRTDPAVEIPEIHVGDRVIIRGRRSIAGQDGTVADIDVEKGQVRLAEWGWLPRKDVEILDSPPDAAAQAASDAEATAPALSENGKRRGTVDSKEAVIDGTMPLEADPLIKPSLDDLVRSLTTAKDTLVRATVDKQRANEAHKDALGAYNAVADQIVEHYGRIEQLGLNLNAEGEGPVTATIDEETEEDGDATEDVPVGSVGVRGRDVSGAE